MVIRVKSFYFGLLAFFLSSCQKDGQDLSICVQLSYGGQPFIMQQEYIYPDGKTFVPTKVSMFLSDISLESANQTLEISDVVFVNFSESHRNAESASTGFLLYQGKTDFGIPQRIHFNIGLTADQNKTVPADYLSGEPLAMPGEYWLAWDSYIFVKIEGKIDLDGNGTLEEGVALHLGSDQVRQSYTLENTAGGPALTILIDIAKIFENDQIYDIEANPQIHSLSQMAALLELSENLKNAVTLKSTQ